MSNPQNISGPPPKDPLDTGKNAPTSDKFKKVMGVESSAESDQRGAKNRYIKQDEEEAEENEITAKPDIFSQLMSDKQTKEFSLGPSRQTTQQVQSYENTPNPPEKIFPPTDPTQTDSINLESKQDSPNQGEFLTAAPLEQSFSTNNPNPPTTKHDALKELNHIERELKKLHPSKNTDIHKPTVNTSTHKLDSKEKDHIKAHPPSKEQIPSPFLSPTANSSKSHDKKTQKIQGKTSPKTHEQAHSKTKEEPIHKTQELVHPKIKNEPVGKIQEQMQPKIEEEPILKTQELVHPKIKNEPVGKIQEQMQPKIEEEPILKTQEQMQPKIKEQPILKTQELIHPKIKEQPILKTQELLHPNTKEKTTAKTKEKPSSKTPDQTLEKPPQEITISPQPQAQNPIEPTSPSFMNASAPYAQFPPQVFELFQKLVGMMTVMQFQGKTTTSIVLNLPSSALDGAHIDIEHFDTAPHAFNISLYTSVEGQIILDPEVQNLEQQLRVSLPDFQISVKKPYLLDETKDKKKQRNLQIKKTR